MPKFRVRPGYWVSKRISVASNKVVPLLSIVEFGDTIALLCICNAIVSKISPNLIFNLILTIDVS